MTKQMNTVPVTDNMNSYSSMSVPDSLLYEYAVIRYVPRIEREEFINVGLLMMCKRCRWLRCGIYLDAERIKSFDVRVNLERLRHQLQLFERPGVPFPDSPVEERYRWLVAAKSACLQTSPSHPGFAYLPSDSSVSYSESTLSSVPAPNAAMSLGKSMPFERREAIAILDNTFERLFAELVK